MSKIEEDHSGEPAEEFGELLRYTALGYAGGLVVGFVLDALGLSRSGLGQWLVRTLAGEGESVCEGIFALRRRLASRAGSLAQAYGWGKVLGLVAPWVVDACSRAAGVAINATQGFYVPFFYAMSDQIGAGIAGFVFLRRRTPTLALALREWLRNPVMLAGLGVVLFVPGALLAVRLLGFSPSNQVLTALETIAANLCWVPPLVGRTCERRLR